VADAPPQSGGWSKPSPAVVGGIMASPARDGRRCSSTTAGPAYNEWQFVYVAQPRRRAQEAGQAGAPGQRAGKARCGQAAPFGPGARRSRAQPPGGRGFEPPGGRQSPPPPTMPGRP
jgi:hypothetical protein